MKGDFFSNYEKFIIVPLEEQNAKQEFTPSDYPSHYILTLSLYDALIENWNEAAKFEIDIKAGLEKVLEEFNRKHGDHYHLQVLELDTDKPYFVLAFSSKMKIESEEADSRIAYVLEILLSNHLYVGQNWYRLIGDKGRIKRQLFSYSFKEYYVMESAGV
ncbi:hypothetical protein SLL00_06510 [Metabacillus indicus]|uniref:hypothetical protein n=1 Tax=Metabacillus indicus TaxID=246786 RepID=UPI002A00C0D0|nr:hypothetical protein [Metabacillus indicus]MDX8289436.1 hypothetical protein [Metabacillus indicus]